MIVRVRVPKIPVWAIMAFSSSAVVITGLVPIDRLEESINLDVILFLIGMFSIVAVAESSGLLEALSLLFLSYARSVYAVVIALSFALGILAAIAVNDTVAVMGPPIVYFVSRALRLDPKPLYVLLAFSITVGSVATPLGNPQNMLIAIESGMSAPFIYFLAYLLLPTLLNLPLTALLVLKYYRIEERLVRVLVVPWEKVRERRDALISGASLIVVIAALLINDVLSLMGYPHVENRGFIPFVVAAAMFIAVSNPREMICRIDWSTILFFIALFITAEGIWNSGLVERVLSAALPSAERGPEGYVVITLLSLLLSQFISNVPFAKLFVEYMHHVGYTPGDVKEWLALAMASTIAGNLTLLGAASNIIILERLERDYRRTIGFVEFAKVGALVTAVNVLVYTPFLIVL
ncbi:MAG: SLC13 family permease [Acidilobaceae archaeon]|nr:SLC13 family permease [Acidilobaceae archaeon]